MIGLREHVRDGALPAMAGDCDLAAPAPDAVREKMEHFLLRNTGLSVTNIDWRYARWKPGVSLTCAYEVALSDGTEIDIATKRYADGKGQQIAARWADEQEPAPRAWGRGDLDLPAPIRLRAHMEDEATVLWAFPSDRALTGLGPLLDGRRMGRLLSEAGVVGPRAVRRRRTRRKLLRYKPERRCVMRIDLALRGSDGNELALGARVHSAPVSTEIAARRAAFERAGGRAFTPRLLAQDERHGLIFEQWLDLESPPVRSFEHAFEAGCVLARLHGLPLPPPSTLTSLVSAAPCARDASRNMMQLFAVDSTLAHLASARDDRPGGGSHSWVHGDCHPDQLGRRVASPADASSNLAECCLLDLDSVGIGDPARDLASWIADALDADPAASPEVASHDLLAGYAQKGGRVPDHRALWRVVGDELTQRASGAIRRLERDAVSHARRLLVLARELSQ